MVQDDIFVRAPPPSISKFFVSRHYSGYFNSHMAELPNKPSYTSPHGTATATARLKTELEQINDMPHNLVRRI